MLQPHGLGSRRSLGAISSNYVIPAFPACATEFFHLLIFLQGSDLRLPFIHSVDICWQRTRHWAFFCSPLTPQVSLWNSQAPFQVTLQEPCSVWVTNGNTLPSNFIIDKKKKHRLIISWKWPFEVCIGILNSSTTRKQPSPDWEILNFVGMSYNVSGRSYPLLQHRGTLRKGYSGERRRR